MQDPLPIVMMLGDRFKAEQHGWRDQKALILLVARSGCWDAAQALCDAFGLDDRTTETLRREAYGYDQPPWSEHTQCADPPRCPIHRTTPTPRLGDSGPG